MNKNDPDELSRSKQLTNLRQSIKTDKSKGSLNEQKVFKEKKGEINNIIEKFEKLTYNANH